MEQLPDRRLVERTKAVWQQLALEVAPRPDFGYSRTMPADLYETDVLAWSEYQADLLRRHARGERVNDVDWDHVVEEIEEVGLSQLNAVRSYLRLMLVHLLKIHCWPESLSVGHWRGEIVSFQADAVQRFAPSMGQRIDLDLLYRLAREQVAATSYDGQQPRAAPDACPFTLDQLLVERGMKLEAVIAAPGARGSEKS